MLGIVNYLCIKLNLKLFSLQRMLQETDDRLEKLQSEVGEVVLPTGVQTIRITEGD